MVVGSPDPLATGLATTRLLRAPDQVVAELVGATATACAHVSGGVDALLAELARVWRRPVWLLDATGERVAGPEPGPADPDIVSTAVPAHDSPASRLAVAVPGGLPAEIAAVTAALAVAAQSMAHLLARQRLTVERDARLRTSLLVELLQTTGDPGPETRRRAVDAGWRLDGWHLGVRIDVPPGVDAVAMRPEVLRAFATAHLTAAVVEQGSGWGAWSTFDHEPGADELQRHASAARRAGSGGLVPRIEEAGFTAFATSPRPHHDQSSASAGRTPLVVMDARATELEFADNFADRGARRMALAVPDVIRSFRPDLVLRDETDLGTTIAAELLDVPVATHLVLAAGLLIRPELVAPRLDAVRAEHGLAADPALTRLTTGVVLQRLGAVVPEPVVAPGPAADVLQVERQLGHHPASRRGRRPAVGLRHARDDLQHRVGRPLRAHPGGARRPRRGRRRDRGTRHRPRRPRAPAGTRASGAVRAAGRRPAVRRPRRLPRWLGQPDGDPHPRAAVAAPAAGRGPAAQRDAGGGAGPRRHARRRHRSTRGAGCPGPGRPR